MKKQKTIILKVKCFLTLILSIFILYSCENQDLNKEQIPTNSNFIGQQEAQAIASGYFDKNNQFGRKIDVGKTTKDMTTYYTLKNEVAYYIINYNEGGFLVLSADIRVSPILAYSDTEYFSRNLNEIPDPILAWMDDEKELIQYVKDTEPAQKPEIKLEWDYATNTGSYTAPINGGGGGGGYPCDDIFIQKGPLLNTSWGQGATYNNLIWLVCPSAPGGRAPTGCVATAMAQVMRYHQKPNTYNWVNMPIFPGTIDTQTLMRDIGTAVGMNYTCTDSGADTTTDVASAFTGSFGYSSATYTGNYDTGIIKQQISANKPVILRGGRKKEWHLLEHVYRWSCMGM